MSDYYDVSGAPITGSQGLSSIMRAEFSLIAAGFAKLPPTTGFANKMVIVNSAGTALTTTGGTFSLAGNLTVTGAFNLTLVVGATVTLTLPLVSGTLATLAGTETLTNKTLTAPAISAPAFSGVSTGSLTLTAATLPSPIVSGTITGTYTIGGTPTGSAILFTSTGTVTARSLATRGTEWVSVKDFGALGDGATNDYTAIDAAFTFILANGGTLYFPYGTYTINSGLIYTSATRPFTIRGDGPGRTIIKRTADFTGSVIEIRSSDNWSLMDFSIDGGNATYTSGDHGITFKDCNSAYIGRVHVSNHKNCGIFGYQTVDGVATHGDHLVENCTVDGLTVATLGIMVANHYRTRFVNCVVKNIDTTANPGYAIQFKNNCRDCVMINPMVFTARIGIVISNDRIAATDGFDCRVYGGYAYNCLLTGMDFAGVSRAQGHHVTIDMANQGNDAMTFDDNTLYSECSISTVNVAAAKGSAKFAATCSDNSARITSMNNLTSGVVNFAAIVVAGGVRNSTVLEKMTTPVMTSASNLFSNAGDTTNTFESLNLNVRGSLVIATGVLTLTNGKTRFVLADTEASAVTDDLDTISAGNDYQLLTFHTANNGRDIVVKHNTGNILLTGAVDFTLSNQADTLTLMYRSALSKWVEVGRGDNS